MLKKKLKKFSLVFTIILLLIAINTSYAAVPVTEDNLKSSLQKFSESEANEDNYNITVENGQINISVENQTYNIKYDLTAKPVFTMEIPIQLGMTYEDFTTKTDGLLLTMLGYVAVANVQGVEIEDASAYFLFSYLSGALANGGLSTENSYVIVDDLNMSEGVTIERTDDPKMIYTSEFGNKVMEYVNNMYNEKQTASDSNGINSYVFSVERTEVTDTSCKLLSTLTVNTDDDYSQIKGYAEQAGDSFLGSDVTEENAEFVVNLKVGQKCKINTNERITGHELNSNNCIEFNEDSTEFKATEVGSTNGYIYIGEEKRSIYVTVEENPGSIYVEDYILNIDQQDISDVLEDDMDGIIEDEFVSEEPVDDATQNEDLPKTGINNYILSVIMVFVLLLIIFLIKLVKIKDIK